MSIWSAATFHRRERLYRPVERPPLLGQERLAEALADFTQKGREREYPLHYGAET